MNQGSHFLQLGLAILIMSSSGTLGRYIDLPVPVIIWIRCVIGSVALYLVIRFGGFGIRISRGKSFWMLFISSIFLGIHWITYFYALKLSSVAVGMLSLFTYPVITALLEPIMLKVKFQKSTVFIGMIAFFGVMLLAPELNFENDYTLGIAMGIFSALTYSIRNILLKKQISDQSGVTLMFYQLLIITLILWPVLFLFNFDVDQSIVENWQPLLILGLFTTAAGHTLFVLSFRHFTISTVSIISALTPLLGTIIGFFVLSEVPAGRTYIGGCLILLTVIAESIRTVNAAKRI
ncbi:MAG: drug/metabolite transporter (DMT)-like permease [Cyclobacteriaceae bacterium]|jgi:drug/metabolite transporter (DMT)-like permease